MITLNGDEVLIDGLNTGRFEDTIANYEPKAEEIQALWVNAHPGDRRSYEALLERVARRGR